MYKLFVFVTLLAAASAAPGFIGAPLASPYAAPWGLGHGYVGAPIVSAPVVKAAVPVATSYANTLKIASPVVAASPYVAPASYLAAPVAHAPLVGGYAHAW